MKLDCLTSFTSTISAPFAIPPASPPKPKYTSIMTRNRDGEPSWKPTVDAVRKYYAFLAHDLGAIPSECIVEPPGGGWPEITQESLAVLEKTDAVIQLLRHLPYIKHSWEYNTHVSFATEAIDYQALGSKGGLKGPRWKLFPMGDKDLPPHVVVLTDDRGGDHYGSQLVIDTERGTATDYQPQGPLKAGMPPPDTPELWRYDTTMSPADLFASWEQKFRSLEWTVDPFNAEGGMMLRWDRATDEVRQIYRDHGWPDDFRREQCRSALREWHRTIDGRLSQPGNNLHEITRQPPGPHNNHGSDSEDDHDEEPSS